MASDRLIQAAEALLLHPTPVGSSARCAADALRAALDADREVAATERARTREIAERVAEDVWEHCERAHMGRTHDQIPTILDRHCGPESAEEREVAEAERAVIEAALRWDAPEDDGVDECERLYTAVQHLRAAREKHQP